MFVIIGIVVLFGSILGGFVMVGGKVAALIQINEYIVVCGACLGAALISRPLPVVMGTFKAAINTMKPSPYTKTAYGDLLKMLFDLFQLARREGLVALEKHVENPKDSDFFMGYTFFLSNHHASAFLSDTMKVVLTGAVEPHDLAEVLESDLEVHHEAALEIPNLINKTADALPGFGIVAAVLGIVITMGSIGGAAAEIGHHVASALVGTFLGILLSYGVVGPIASGVEAQIQAEGQYLGCMKTAILSFARGDSPMTCVEFARRSLPPEVRCSFSELEARTSVKK